MAEVSITPSELDEDTAAHYHHMMSRTELEKEKLRAQWHPMRRYAAEVAESHRFEMTLSACISINFVLMVVETDQNADCANRTGGAEDCQAEMWVNVINNILLAMYTLESAIKLYAFRRHFFQTAWNNIDFSIVCMGLADLLISSIAGDIIPNLSMLRMFRIARLVRAVRILTAFRELYLMVHGFASAMMSMFWGFVMMCILLTVWSILAVELINPMNLEIEHEDAWCDEVFSSVIMSNLYFFQTVVAGDSWGQCAIPILKSDPGTFPIFAGIIFTVQIGLTNLILAVIVEQAAQSREGDKEQQLKEQKKAEEGSRNILMKLCKDIDTNDNGELTKQELQEGFTMDPKFAMHLQLLGIEGDMLDEIFEIMDRDQSGAVDYEEFIDTLHKSRTQDTRMLLTMVKFELFGELKKLRDEIEIILHKVVGNSPVSSRSPSRQYQKEDTCGYQVEGSAPTSPFSPTRATAAVPQFLQSTAAQSPAPPRPVLPQDAVTQPTDTKPPEDVRLFLETLRAQMTYMLDSVASKFKEQSISEEKAKLDSSNFGTKTTLLPPTFTPDGQWQLILKPEWQLCGAPMVPARHSSSCLEAKDGQPSDPALGGTWSLQPGERSLMSLPSASGSAPAKAPPPRTTPLSTSASNAVYTCDPMICHQRMEVIHVSRPGLPPMHDDVQGSSINDPHAAAQSRNRHSAQG